MYNPSIAIFKKPTFYKKSGLIIIGLFIAVIIGIAIVDKQWVYMAAFITPFLLYLCIKKPFIFPFGTYVLLIPFDSVLSVTGSAVGMTMTKLLAVMTILVFFLKGTLENKLIKPNSASIWLLLFISYGLLSVWWAIQPDLVFSIFSTTIGLFLLYFIVSSYRIQKSEFEILKWCIVVGGFIAALFTILIYIKGHFYATNRFSLMVGERSTNPNTLAYTLIIPISVCVHMMLRQNKKYKKVLFGIVLSVLIFVVIITGSRSGLLGVLSVILTYNLLTKKKATFVAIFIIIGIILLHFAPEFIFERIDDAVETKGSGRTHILYVYWRALEKYWLFGAGLNNGIKAHTEFYIYSPSAQGIDRGAHNFYLGTFVELGIIGIILLFLMIMKHYRNLSTRFSQHCSEIIMLKAAFWGVLINSFFADPLFVKSFWLLWMIISMKINLSREKNLIGYC